MKYLYAVEHDQIPIEYGTFYNQTEQQWRFIAFQLKSLFCVDTRSFYKQFNEDLVDSSTWEKFSQNLLNLVWPKS